MTRLSIVKEQNNWERELRSQVRICRIQQTVLIINMSGNKKIEEGLEHIRIAEKG